MAYNANQLYSSATVAALKRVIPKRQEVVTFAAGSGTLAALTPLAYNKVTDKWQVWTGKSNEILTITAAASANTGGTFTLTVNGVTTAAIAHNATPAAIKLAMITAGVGGPLDITVTETAGGIDANNGVLTIEFTGALANQVLTATATLTSLTGGSVATVAEAQAGLTLDATGGSTVKGFVWPEAVVLDSDEEVMGIALLEGEVHYSDIVLPAGETESVLQAALRAGARTQGLVISGLTLVR